MNLVFVYGTLRPGCSEWARGGYVADPVPATAKGTLYDYGPFPYCDFNGTDIIVGALLTLDDDTADHVYRVEVGAGYIPRQVQVTLADGAMLTATAYDIPAINKQMFADHYPVIPSGDWLLRWGGNADMMERTTTTQ
jgi:gamma-glutamylcyclotransferase (GGCT)/AIG2-like uncharacterized protein YtfP